MNYKIKNISKENFKNYGDLITTSNKNYESINKDTTDSFFDLANIQIIGDDKRSRLNIFHAKKKTIFYLNFFFLYQICIHQMIILRNQIFI